MLDDPQPDGSGIGTVLVVEDEALVSVMIENLLHDVGAHEVIVCGGPEEARALIGRRMVHCAILDVGIDGGDDCFALADDLDHRYVPFFFATVAGPEAIAERHRHRHRPILAKPFSDVQLLDFVRATMAGAREMG